jgi:hypothetical protein
VTYEKKFLRNETNTWTLASEPAEDSIHRGLNPDHLNSSSALYQLSKWHMKTIFFGMRPTLGRLFQSQPRAGPPSSEPRPSDFEFSALPTELSDIWKILSSVWDQHLAACFRAIRGSNPPRFEIGPSELEFSALPNWAKKNIFLRMRPKLGRLLQSQPRIDPTEVWTRAIWTRIQRSTNWAKWHMNNVFFGMIQTLGRLLQSQPRIWTKRVLNPDHLNSSSALYQLS